MQNSETPPDGNTKTERQKKPHCRLIVGEFKIQHVLLLLSSVLLLFLLVTTSTIILTSTGHAINITTITMITENIITRLLELCPGCSGIGLRV